MHNHTSLTMRILEYFTQKFAEHNCAPHYVLICCTVLTEEKTWFYLLQLLSFKQVEKLEVHVQELVIKIEELNRTIVDITSHKTRLSQVCKCQVSQNVKKDKILTVKKLHTSKCVLSPLNVGYTVSSSTKFLTNLKFCLL